MGRATVADAMARVEVVARDIQTHEAVCAERYGGIAKAIETLTRKQDQAIAWIIATLVAGLGGAIGMIFVLVVHF